MKSPPRFLPLWLLLVACATLPAQDTRLSNVSVRTSAGGADVLITGFTIGPGSDKTILVRAVGPTLGAFGVTGTLANPKLELYNSSSVKIAENDNFNASDAPTFAAVGAFALGPNARDAALVATLAPGSYTAQISGIGGANGVALVEVYEVTGGATRLINLSTRAQVGTGGNILIPGITIAPGAGTRRLLLRAVGPTLGVFGVPGTLADPKLELYSGTIRIAENDNWGTPVGSAAADATTLSTAFTANGAFALTDGSKDAALLLNLGAGSYTLQVSGVAATTGAALVEVYDLTPANQTGARPNASLYLAQLRPQPSAAGSLASGYATILINPDGSATLSISLSNLSSPITASHLQIGLAGANYVLDLPRGQVNDLTWHFHPTGPYTTNDLVNALNAGNLVVALDTARFPAGEVRAAFSAATGSQTFTPPAAPPALPTGLLATPADVDAGRLLLQATFGPTDESIAEVKRLGVDGWIRAQIAMPPTSFRKVIRDEIALYPTPEIAKMGGPQAIVMNLTKNMSWWTLAVESPDQLRQRVGFALSELFVVTDPNGTPLPEELNFFYDNLVARAFGNFRDLLEFVSLNPVMAWNLTFMRNQKADPARGTSPDENYAREVQQLFTVGLVQLQPDGTLLLDRDGKPIPTYDNETITETAKIFTGWAYQNERDNFFDYPGRSTTREFEPDNAFVLRPLKNYAAYRDPTEKRVISLEQKWPREAAPTVIRAGLSAQQDLTILIDTLFRHPNTGPFICRQLIQRLVTSNPSPGYVYRVAQVFANNGSGVRGDLGAVIRAILLDYEARSPDSAANAGFGKIKEPLIRTTALWRLMKTRSPRGGFWDSFWGDPRGDRYHPSNPWLFGIQATLGQNVLQSPSVFNFFSPTYTAPGPLSSAGLVAPEMQITDASFAIKVPNFLTSLVYKVPPIIEGAPTPSPFLANDFSALLDRSADPAQLVDRLNVLLAGGQMRATTRTAIQQAVAAIPAVTPVNNHAAAPRFGVNTSLVQLTAPKVAAFDPGGPFTLEAWVLPFFANQNTFIMGKGVSGDPHNLFTLSMSGNRFLFASSSGAAGSARTVFSNAQDVVLGSWTHVAGVFDGSVLRLYINGVLRNQITGASVPRADPNTPFSIGQSFAADGRTLSGNFEGVISQPRFWNVARTVGQIAAGMTEGKPADTTGLIAGWLFDEGSGAIAADYSGHGYTLRPNSTLIEWAPMNGTNLERVRAALHLAVVSTDVAFQK